MTTLSSKQQKQQAAIIRKAMQQMGIRIRNTSNRVRTRRGFNPTRRARSTLVTPRNANPHDAYIRMVADPCHSTLVPGLYGSSEGLLARLKSSIKVPTGFGTTCGFCLWCPDYTPEGKESLDPGIQQQNCVLWTGTDPSRFPTNTAATPFAQNRIDIQDAEDNTGWVLPDPAGPLNASEIVADARVLNSCMQMTYYGSMLESAGEIAFISNIPVTDLLTGGKGENVVSVDNLMAFATSKQRFGVDTLESVYRLNPEASHHFRNEATSPLVSEGGVAATSLTDEVRANPSRMFGFVWRNTAPDAGLSIDLTKSVEWRAEASSGLAQVAIHSSGPSKVPHINTAIDRVSKQGGKSIWERVSGASGELLGITTNALRAIGGSPSQNFGAAGNALQTAGLSAARRQIESAFSQLALMP